MKYGHSITKMLLACLAWVIIWDIWYVSGLWICFCVILILINLLKIRYTLIWCIAGLFIGYYLAIWAIDTAQDIRESLGTHVWWWAFQNTIHGTAGEKIQAWQFSHTYRLTITKIDTTEITPRDIGIMIPPNLSLIAWDKVEAIGRFSFPLDTDEFAAEKQSWKSGIYAQFRAFDIQKTPPESYGVFIRLRIWLLEKLSLLFPEKWQNILSGIILWQKNNFDPEMKEALKNSGLMHIMVVSGGNIMMLIICISLFIRAFHPIIRIIIISSTVVSFALLVWGDVPVWRATLMWIIGYSAHLWWMTFTTVLLPILVACILAFINPLSLVYDIGLQLSFLSVICIIIVSKKLTKLFHFLGNFFDEALALTVAATIGTLPITIYYFGTFSLAGPIANLLAAPAIPIIMYGGIATLILSGISDTLAIYVWYIPWTAVTYLITIIEMFGKNTYLSHIELGHYRDEFLTISLALLTIILIYFQTKNKKKSK